MERCVDGLSTTVAWQVSPTRIAVLPVGSFEQHGARLPLATDTLFAEHCARVLADDLGAALLPALPYGSSFEHTGFRGSLSLRPETSMAILRDLAASLARQNFTRLVLVNGHGGNFHLGPVVRDLNAQDLPIKLVLVDCDRSLDKEVAEFREGELHAGASEIARLSALRPDLVRPPDAAAPENAAAGRETFVRSDLNSFGLGTRHPSGVWGDATAGDAASGAAMWASIEAHLKAHVRERLAWLEAQPAYAGRGGIAVRNLLPQDLPDALRLCREAGWNQTEDDWRLLQRLSPDGVFVAVHMGFVVGTVVALDYGEGNGWIGMMLVDAAHRRRGIGTQLMRAALGALGPGTALDATPAGQKLYYGLGFAATFPIDRLVRPAGRTAPAMPAGVRPMEASDLPAVVALDRSAFGASRPRLLSGLFERSAQYAWVVPKPNGGIAAFVMGRDGQTFDSLGPLVAEDAGLAAAVLGAAASAAGGRTVGIDAPRHAGWADSLAAAGFGLQRSFVRMVRKPDRCRGNAALLYGTAGPEFG